MGATKYTQHYRLDGSRVWTREDLYVALTQALPMIDAKLSNLDGLYDALSALARPTELVIDHATSLEQALGHYGGTFFQVLQDASRANPYFGFERREC